MATRSVFNIPFGNAWLLILEQPPNTKLQPQRQLSLLCRSRRLAREGGTQFVIATHSTILMTYPGASLLSLDGSSIKPTQIEDTSHFRITKGLLDACAPPLNASIVSRT